MQLALTEVPLAPALSKAQSAKACHLFVSGSSPSPSISAIQRSEKMFSGETGMICCQITRNPPQNTHSQNIAPSRFHWECQSTQFRRQLIESCTSQTLQMLRLNLKQLLLIILLRVVLTRFCVFQRGRLRERAQGRSTATQ